MRGGEGKVVDNLSVLCKRCQWERMMFLTARVAGWYWRARMGRSEVESLGRGRKQSSLGWFWTL